MKFCLSILFNILFCLAFGQQRICFDFNTSGSNLYATASYQKVVGSNFILNGGILFGQLGHSSIYNDREFLNGTFSVQSPIPNGNISKQIDTVNFDLLSYRIKSTGIAIQLGGGYFHEFNIKHGLKFQLLGRIGYVESEMLGKYYSTEIKGQSATEGDQSLKNGTS